MPPINFYGQFTGMSSVISPRLMMRHGFRLDKGTTVREDSGMKNIALITAGGSGRRMPGPRRKQYLEILGKPVLVHCLNAFLSHPSIEGVVLTHPADDGGLLRELLETWFPGETRVTLANGGVERQDSVYNGLRACPADTAIVLVQDGVRPRADACDIDRLLEAAQIHGGAIPVTPLQYTLKRAAEGMVVETVPRENLYLVHTPQVFRYDLLMEAHESARKDGVYLTDDAGLLERMGRPVAIVEVSEPQIKITRPGDLALAEHLLRETLRS
jgi:2-C-methyl-D-erythritol 4-phosphate cytidylyltransferase